MNKQTKIYAILHSYKDGSEGIVTAVRPGSDNFIPLVAMDLESLDILKALAYESLQNFGMEQFRVVCFSNPELIEVLK